MTPIAKIAFDAWTQADEAGAEGDALWEAAANAVIEECAKFLEERAADAGRYRWLRDDAHHDYLDRLITFGTDEWDETIDAAMAIDKA